VRNIIHVVVVLLTVALLPFSPARAISGGIVSIRRLPDGGLQPQVAVGTNGRVHVIYFRGESSHGDVFYMHSTDGRAEWSQSIRVNSTPGTAIATGTVRGAQIALGKGDRIHVAWNGAQSTRPGVTPMFYTRSDAAHAEFEPQRAVMSDGYDIDGGGAVAADRTGHVYLVWHANAPGEQSEGARHVWLARSSDDGQTFERERIAWDQPTGACGCCGLGAFADTRGSLYILFRSAFDVVNRDMYLLTSRDHGEHFLGRKVDRWNVGMCVMSTQAFAEGVAGVFTAWETKGQVYLARINPDNGRVLWSVGATGEDRTRKHPAIAVNSRGQVLFAWTEKTAWNKGGSAAWQLLDGDGHVASPVGQAKGVPVWGLVGAYARADDFTLVY
jgi:hypothetical protein